MNNLAKMKYVTRYVQLIKCTACYCNIHKVLNFHHNSRFSDFRITHFCTVTSYENNSVNNKQNVVIKLTSDFGIKEKSVLKIVETNPDLLNISSNSWIRTLTTLLNSGFAGHECIEMIAICPKLLEIESLSLQEALECWSSVKLGENNILSLVVSCPELLFVNLKDLPKKIHVLRSLGSNKNVLNLLRTCPNVVFENCDTLLQKIDYIENEMKISPEKILKCQALGRSLYELKARHIFLERAGKYVPPNPKKDPKEYSTNPSLKQITDTDDLKFATFVAGLTLEEYEFFVELYRIEENESDLEDDYS